MTTDAERECYYKLAKQAAGKGAIVELGAWMGASTAYIAAGIRDSGVQTKAHVYDQFISKAGHTAKVKAFYDKQGIDAIPVGPSLETFKSNLGPLLGYIEAHQGKIEQMQWGNEPIALMITDAPKRIPAISSVLTNLRRALQPGSIMAWQDFCHFPSYEIPACLYRIRKCLSYVEAVVPGTTLVFRVRSQWLAEEVTQDAFALDKWTPDEIAEAWDFWLEFVHPEKRSLFRCGAALFLCDIGQPDRAVVTLAKIVDDDAAAIMKKWRYLNGEALRPDLVTRYQPLFAYLAAEGVL